MRLVIEGGIVEDAGNRPQGDEVLVPVGVHDPEVDGITYPTG